MALVINFGVSMSIKNSGENSLDDKGEFVREKGGKGDGVKGNAFRELTLVASPNVSDGFLSFFDCPSSSPRCVPLIHHGSCQLDPTRHVVDSDDEREKRSGAELWFVFSVPGIAN